jgi:hypothetical protein
LQDLVEGLVPAYASADAQRVEQGLEWLAQAGHLAPDSLHHSELAETWGLTALKDAEKEANGDAAVPEDGLPVGFGLAAVARNLGEDGPLHQLQHVREAGPEPGPRTWGEGADAS